MPSRAERIAAIRKLAASLTDGPWYDDGYRVYGPSPETLGDRRNAPVLFEYKHSEAIGPHDGQFIAAVRNMVDEFLALATKSEALAAAVERRDLLAETILERIEIGGEAAVAHESAAVHKAERAALSDYLKEPADG